MKILSDYMKIKHRMEIVEDAEEGGFVVSFPELPGCFTCGDTKEKAIANAIDAKRAWFEAALEAGMEINIPGVPSKNIKKHYLTQPQLYACQERSSPWDKHL